MAGRREHVGTAQKIGEIDFALRKQIAHRDFHDRYGFAGLNALRHLLEAALRGCGEVQIHVGHRAKSAARHEHRFLVQHLGRLQHLAARREHGSAREAELHEPQAQDAIVDSGEFVTREIDQVDLDAVGA